MIAKRTVRIAVILMLLYCPCSSYGWGVTGHRIVAEIAARHLNAKAKARVRSILDGVSMPVMANWADFVRSDKAYDYLVGWHYINMDDGLSKTAFEAVLQQDTATDIFTKTTFLIERIGNSGTPKDSMRFYLAMLVHLVGDAHQPMHVSRESDYGGSKLTVLWFNDTTNLHRLWDEDLINFQRLSYTEYADALDLPSKKNAAAVLQRATAGEWLYESYVLSQGIYAEINGSYPKFGYRYNFDHIGTVNDRLYTAGIRLAGILNRAFGR